jgi:hypothetical protein
MENKFVVTKEDIDYYFSVIDQPINISKECLLSVWSHIGISDSAKDIIWEGRFERMLEGEHD